MSMWNCKILCYTWPCKICIYFNLVHFYIDIKCLRRLRKLSIIYMKFCISFPSPYFHQLYYTTLPFLKHNLSYTVFLIRFFPIAYQHSLCDKKNDKISSFLNIFFWALFRRYTIVILRPWYLYHDVPILDKSKQFAFITSLIFCCLPTNVLCCRRWPRV